MCGIFALYNTNPRRNIMELLNGMYNLRHRGKDGYGILLYNEKFIEYKNCGEINNDISIDKRQKIKFAMGHNRYRTSGKKTKNNTILNLQPLHDNIDDKKIYMCHNGNIPNIKGFDTHYLLKFIKKSNKKEFVDKLIELIETIPAAYSLIIFYNEKLYILRDRYGIRPLCIGENKHSWYISSESCAFSIDSYCRDVKPGELIQIDHTGLTTIYQYKNSVNGICLFEMFYFLNPNSFVDGMYVKKIREHLGKLLAKKDWKWNKDYIVIGIPETGIVAGKSYASESGYEYHQYITKNKLSSRSFILDTNEKRIEYCKKKFIYNRNKLKNKKVIIVDDSIVRGNVIKSIIYQLKDCGVKEIHIRIPAPPVIDICELGIAITSKEELLMHNKTVREVVEELEIDSLSFLMLNEIDIFTEDNYDQCFSGKIRCEIKNWNDKKIE